jgi:hypothetical protein
MRNPLRARLSHLEADHKAKPQPRTQSDFSFLSLPEKILLEQIWTLDANFYTTETPDEIRAKIKAVADAREQVLKDF